MTLRFGIIGPGAIAARHAEALIGAGAGLVAVAGPNREQAEAFATAHGGARTFATAEELCAQPRLDAVVVASPSSCHAEHTITALRSGLHVLCEIPVATSLADAQQVAAEAVAAGRHVAVGHTLRFCHPYRVVRDMVDDGVLDVGHVVARTLMQRQRDVGAGGRPRDWTDDVLWHHGAHTVDAALWFLDDVPSHIRGAQGPPWPGSGRAMDVGVVLRTWRGTLATVALSYHSRRPHRDVVIIAEDRTLELSGGRLRDGDRVLIDEDTDRMERFGLIRQDRDVLAALTAGRRPACTVEDVLPAMRVLDELGAVK